MKGKKLHNDELAALLRQAFPEDMSAEQEQLLKIEAQAAWVRAQSASPLSRRGGWMWSLKRLALATASLAMLIIGGAMQRANRPHLLANSLSGLQTSSAVMNNLENAGRMVCQMVTTDVGGHTLRFEVDWHAAGETKVTRSGIEGTVVRSIHAESDLSDPVLEPALDFLTPSTVANLLKGGWEARSDPESAKLKRATFLVQSPGSSTPWTLTLDLETYYPIALTGSDKGQVRFQWEPGEIPEPFLFRQPREPRQGGV